MSKKIRKIVSKVTKVVDPISYHVNKEVVDPMLNEWNLPAMTGTSANELARQQQEKQAEIMQQGVNAQVANNHEASRMAALQMQQAADRERANAAAQEAIQPVKEAPEVELAADTGTAANRRKKFHSSSVGGSGGGTSIRL